MNPVMFRFPQILYEPCNVQVSQILYEPCNVQVSPDSV